MSLNYTHIIYFKRKNKHCVFIIPILQNNETTWAALNKNNLKNLIIKGILKEEMPYICEYVAYPAGMFPKIFQVIHHKMFIMFSYDSY